MPRVATAMIQATHQPATVPSRRPATGSTSPTRPPPSPSTVAGPTAGAAARLAATATRLTWPESPATTGVQASWAAAGIAIASADPSGQPARHRVPPARREQHDPGGGQHRQREARLHGQAGLHQQQHDDRDTERPGTAPSTVGAHREQRDRPHHRRAEHARLGAREQHEADDPERAHDQQRSGHAARPTGPARAGTPPPGSGWCRRRPAGGSARWCGSRPPGPRRGRRRRRRPGPAPARAGRPDGARQRRGSTPAPPRHRATTGRGPPTTSGGPRAASTAGEVARRRPGRADRPHAPALPSGTLEPVGVADHQHRRRSRVRRAAPGHLADLEPGHDQVAVAGRRPRAGRTAPCRRPGPRRRRRPAPPTGLCPTWSRRSTVTAPTAASTQQGADGVRAAPAPVRRRDAHTATATADPAATTTTHHPSHRPSPRAGPGRARQHQHPQVRRSRRVIVLIGGTSDRHVRGDLRERRVADAVDLEQLVDGA